MTDSRREYVMRVHDEGDGMLWGEVDELPGCFASGKNLDELVEAMTEAITLYVAEAPPGAIPISRGRRRKAGHQVKHGRAVSASICVEA
jgi:predicted RNase H-like HicB family nuclease